MLRPEHHFQRQPTEEALRDGAESETKFPVPISLTQRDTVEGNHFDIAATFALFTQAGPSAITRFIVAVAVDAIKCMTIWPSAHVAQEVLKASPRLTNSDTDGTVSNIATVIDCVAPINHCAPRTIFGGSARVLCMAMLEAGDVSFGEKHSRYFSGGAMC